MTYSPKTVGQQRILPDPIVNGWQNEPNIDDKNLQTCAGMWAGFGWGGERSIIYDLGANRDVLLEADIEFFSAVSTDWDFFVEYSTNNINYYEAAHYKTINAVNFRRAIIAEFYGRYLRFRGYTRWVDNVRDDIRIYEVSLYY